jgi:hypothetical protein
MLRRRILAWLLPLTLLITQQFALLHELSHLRGADETDLVSESGAHHAKHDEHHKACSLCLAFSHVSGGALHLVPPALARIPLCFLYESFVATGLITADSPVARSRGPPRLL